MDWGSAEQAVADTLTRLPGGIRLLAALRVRGRARIVDRLPADAVPPGGVVERYGALFDLDTSEQIQRQLWFRAFEPRDLRLAIRLVPVGGTAIDVGANIGAYALPLAAKADATGRVDAFEPAPEVYRRLCSSARLNGFSHLHCWQSAVSDHSGTATLHQPPGWNRGGAALDDYDRAVASDVDVLVTTIDDHLQEQAINKVDLLKVDIEGHEPELLAGASKALESHQIDHVLIEFNGHYVRQRGHTVDSFFRPLRDAEYVPHRMRVGLLRKMLLGDIDPATVCENFLWSRTPGEA